MAGKDDFSKDEWEELQKGVTGAGMLVSVSHRDFTDSFGEASTLAKDLGAHRESESQLVRELAETHGTGFGFTASPSGGRGRDAERPCCFGDAARREGAGRARCLSRSRARRCERGGGSQGWRPAGGDGSDREDHGRTRGRRVARLGVAFILVPRHERHLPDRSRQVVTVSSGAPRAATSTSTPRPGPTGAEPKPFCERGS